MYEPVRRRLARQLHARGVHTICHTRQVVDGYSPPVSFRREDGTVYTPQFTNVYGLPGVPIIRQWHS